MQAAETTALDNQSRDNSMPTRRKAVVQLALSALVFLLLEGLFFRTHLYPSLLEPNSTTGQIESTLGNELRRYQPLKKQILAIGDSRMGLYPRVANQLTHETGYTFASIAVPGATMRSWFYMLRRVDPEANKYAAVILPVDHYDDEETLEDIADRLTDLNYSISNLRLADVPEFSFSFHTPSRQYQVFRDALLKGILYKRDFQAFLLHPAKRLDDVELYRRGSADWNYNYSGEKRSLQGLVVDWTTKTISFPPGLTDDQQALLKRILLAPELPNKGLRAAFQRKWLGKILDHYSGSQTRLVFLRLPRGPVVRPNADAAYNPASSIRQFASRPNVILLAEHTFDELEQPDLFMDPLHMNAAGCTKFSQQLAREASRRLRESR